MCLIGTQHLIQEEEQDELNEIKNKINYNALLAEHKSELQNRRKTVKVQQSLLPDFNPSLEQTESEKEQEFIMALHNKFLVLKAVFSLQEEVAHVF